MKIILILITLFTSSVFAEAGSMKIKELILKDGSRVNTEKEVESIEFSDDRENNIEWVELKEGTLLDSTDIERVLLETNREFDYSDYFVNNNQIYEIPTDMSGDGSGG